jgi:hypothetical protein
MSIKRGTKEDLDTMVLLEKIFFPGREEIREAYEFFLEHGQVLIEYDDKQEPTGMLVTISVDKILQNIERILTLPEKSPFRERVRRGYLNGYSGYVFIPAFVSRRYSPSLTEAFLNIEKAVGFVYGDDTKALKFYRRCGCTEVGNVENIHSPEKRDIVLVYKKTNKL